MSQIIIIYWKRPLRTPSHITKSHPLIPYCHVHISLKHLQGCGLHYFPRQSVSMLDCSLYEEILPKIQTAPRHNLRLFAHVLSLIREILRTSLQTGEESGEETERRPQQTKQPQFPQPLLLIVLFSLP